MYDGHVMRIPRESIYIHSYTFAYLIFNRQGILLSTMNVTNGGSACEKFP